MNVLVTTYITHVCAHTHTYNNSEKSIILLCGTYPVKKHINNRERNASHHKYRQ